MNRTSIYSTILGAVLILSFTAQSLLLIDTQWLLSLFKGIDTNIVLFSSIFVFIFSIILLLAPVFDYRPFQFNLTLFGAIILMSGLAWIYISAQFITNALILITLILATTAFLVDKFTGDKKEEKNHQERDWLLIMTPVLSTALSVGIFLKPDKILPADFISKIAIQQFQYLAGAFFGIAALFGIFGLVKLKLPKAIFARIMSIPWIGLSILLFIYEFSLQSIIPTLSLGFVLAFYGFIPWDRLVLPEDGELGYRIARLSAIANISVLVAITVAINASYPETDNLTAARWIAMICFNLFAIATTYAALVVNISINGLMKPLPPDDDDEQVHRWNIFIDQLIGPLTSLQSSLRSKIKWQERQIKALNTQLQQERTRAIQFSILKELTQQLEPVLDYPVSSQLTASVLQRAFGSVLVAIFKYEPEKGEFLLVSAAGHMTATIPAGYRQSAQKGIIGRAGRTRKVQLVNNTEEDQEYLKLEQQIFKSELVLPLIYKNQLKGAIVVDDEHTNAFNPNDIDTVEAAGSQLLASWERSDYDNRLTQLVEGGIALSSILDPEAALDQVAIIAQKILGAHFCYVLINEKKSGRTRTASAGYAPPLLTFMQRGMEENELVQSALTSGMPFRIRDVRKQLPNVLTGFIHLRTALIMPLQLRNENRGAILAFGKQGEVTFTDSDEALGNLLSNQAAAAIDSAGLHEEIREMLSTATTLYQLSTRVIQAEKLTDAAAAIAESARRLGNASAAGIVLYRKNGEVQTQVQIDASGISPGNKHPFIAIRQSMESSERIIQSWEGQASICLPLQTPQRTYGTLWLEIPEEIWQHDHYADNLQTLANQAAIALERSILLVETREKTEQLRAAFEELEITYNQTLIALTTALDARDRETEGHSVRVTRMSMILAEKLGLSDKQLKLLERGALLHDIGKIGISDTILHKPGKLTEDEWVEMRKHPDIGARIVEGIPFLEPAIPVIRYHQERWDGSGYPIGLKGQDIPQLARIFAVADTFDALTSIRPYRTRISPQEALQYIKEQAYIQFDPDVVRSLEKALNSGEILSLMAE